jgi:hypothetical protein
MNKDSVRSRLLGPVLDRFPEYRKTVLNLALSNQTFRSLCEELALARESLAQFEARPDADLRPEIPEYRTIIREIEDEIEAHLASRASG